MVSGNSDRDHPDDQDRTGPIIGTATAPGAVDQIHSSPRSTYARPLIGSVRMCCRPAQFAMRCGT